MVGHTAVGETRFDYKNAVEIRNARSKALTLSSSITLPFANSVTIARPLT